MNFTLNKTNLYDTITFIKAFAIIMVVLLHSSFFNKNEVVNYINLNYLTPFRMPAFMFVSGFLYIYVTRKKNPDYKTFFFNKFSNLLVPL